ncbi:SUMO1 sentrin specific peptidase 8 [Homalodisca vitripennis]|nr:SUMO1 sentrin specific peptidase 8 [Homalodisca vitripennis]
MENYSIELLSEFKYLTINYPNIDCGKPCSLLAYLMKEIDSTLYDYTLLQTTINDLSCNLALLESKLACEKEVRRSEMNDSFKFQDQAVFERDELEAKICKLKDELSSSQVALKNVCLENDCLKYRISELNKDAESNNIKVAELNSCKASLLKSLNNINSKPSNKEWSKLRWVDDKTIQCYVDACEQHIADRDDVTVLGPCTAHWIKLSEGVIAQSLLSQMSVQSKKLILCCVSNSIDKLSDDSGSHWSLLFIDKNVKQAYHLYSYRGANFSHALKLSTNLGISEENFIDAPCIQQKNNFECGLNLMVNLKIIVNCYIRPKIPTLPLLSANKVLSNSMISIASETLKSKENSLPVLRLKKCGEDGWRVVSPKQSAKPKYMSNKLSILPLKHSSRALPDDNVNNSLNDSFHPSVKKPTSKVKQSKGVSTGSVSSSFRVKEMSVYNNVDMPPKDVQSVLLLSDSHGRRLCGKVKLLVKPAVKTESVVLPGKKFECVMEGSNLSGLKLTKQDYVVILAGTNNVPDHCDGLCVSLGRALEGLVDTNVIVLGIPKRFDAPNLNDVINGVNRDFLLRLGDMLMLTLFHSSVSQGDSLRGMGCILTSSGSEGLRNSLSMLYRAVLGKSGLYLLGLDLEEVLKMA